MNTQIDWLKWREIHRQTGLLQAGKPRYMLALYVVPRNTQITVKYARFGAVWHEVARW